MDGSLSVARFSAERPKNDEPDRGVRMRFEAWLALVLLDGTMACRRAADRQQAGGGPDASLAPGTPASARYPVAFTSRPPVEHPLDLSGWRALGCSLPEPQASWGLVQCPAHGATSRFGCAELRVPPSALAGLGAPVVFCERDTAGPPCGGDRNLAPWGRAVQRAGCMCPVERRLLALVDGALVELADAEAVRRQFAPVDSREKALAFVVALEDRDALYDTPRWLTDGYGLVPSIEATTVVPKGDGFLVRVFGGEGGGCGCGTHPWFALEYEVDRAGSVREVARQKVIEHEHEVCVD
jgi:hypothetical protein